MTGSSATPSGDPRTAARNVLLVVENVALARDHRLQKQVFVSAKPTATGSP